MSKQLTKHRANMENKKTKEQKTPRGRKAKYSPERVAKICEEIAKGATFERAAKIGGISTSTFFEWQNTKPEFSDAVKKAQANYEKWYEGEIVGDCKRSLLELVRGYEWTETTTETAIGKDGKETITKKKTVHKRVAPNPTAIIFALCNRDPEHWQNRVNQELSGKIETENKPGISLSNVPDNLLAQVIQAINGK